VGNSDYYITSFYKDYVLRVADLQNVKTIAWLGWPADNNALARDIIKMCPKIEKSDCYDIVLGENTIQWDINKKWDISGYDLVICFRTSTFVKDVDHFLSELHATTLNNRVVIFDFMLPELRSMKDYTASTRQQIKKHYGLPDNLESYFSWCKLYNIITSDTQQETKVPESVRSQIDNNNSLPVVKTRLHAHRKGPQGSFFLVSKFDSIYENSFKREVGIEYNPKTMAYLDVSPKTLLTEQKLYENKIEMKNAEFHYMLNYIPEDVGWLSEDDGKVVYKPYDESPPEGTKYFVTLAMISLRENQNG